MFCDFLQHDTNMLNALGEAGKGLGEVLSLVLPDLVQRDIGEQSSIRSAILAWRSVSRTSQKKGTLEWRASSQVSARILGWFLRSDLCPACLLSSRDSLAGRR
jgi:hypothetical protein